MKQIILASISPRRKKLMEKTGIKFRIAESKLKEYFDPKLKPQELAEKLSLGKARNVCSKYKNTIIIAADTLIVIDNKALGKPKDEKEAIGMLRLLNGKMHCVITGFTIYDTQGETLITKSIISKVFFNKISEKEIRNYVFAKKPFDKAGGYGIQELPKIFIRKTQGDYDNIMGLPVNAVLKELKKIGVF